MMRDTQARRLGFWTTLSAAALISTTVVSVAPAAPLDQQTCDQLKREVVQLEGMGTRDHLAKGAAWGKANLRSAQLEQVKKLIEMDEAIAFRCPRPKPEPPPGAAAAGKAKTKVQAKAVAKTPAGEGTAAPADQAKAKPKPKPKAAAATDGSAGTPAAQPQPRPRPPAPKPKPADAYTPPPKAPAAQ